MLSQTDLRGDRMAEGGDFSEICVKDVQEIITFMRATKKGLTHETVGQA